MKAVAELDHQDVDATSPAAIHEARDETAAALAALEMLPSAQRDCLRLRFSGGMSYKQIAEATGKSVNNVGVLIHEGLKTLRTQLAPALQTEGGR